MRAILFLLMPLFWISCTEGSRSQFEPKVTALGVMNEIVVIADQEVWESEVGDTFRYYFESAYPILPTPEPLFDLRHFTVSQIEGQPLRKELRTYIALANLSDEESPTTRMVKKDLGEEKFNQALNSENAFSTVGRNKWAVGQLLIYIFGKDRNSLKDAIVRSYPAAAKRINQHDEKQLNAAVYLDRINLGLGKELASRMGLSINVPGEYKVVIRDYDNDVIWLRKDTRDAILNLVVKKIKYINASQFSRDSMVAIRNEFGRQYITSDFENDRMVVNTEDLPVYDYVTEVDGQYAMELRGTWEMTEDFIAGPFISYLIKSPSADSLIFVDGFVLAPGERKRNMMMQLEHIIRQAEIN